MTPKLVIHPPTAGALPRARPNRRNLLAVETAAEVEPVADAEATRTALAEPYLEADAFPVLCRNSFEQAGLMALQKWRLSMPRSSISPDARRKAGATSARDQPARSWLC
jgi:hypothetical protein